MQQVAQGYKGLGLLFEVNNDRLLSIIAIAVAFGAVGWMGVEYVNSFIAADSFQTVTAIL